MELEEVIPGFVMQGSPGSRGIYFERFKHGGHAAGVPDFHRKFAGATDVSDAGNPQIKMPRQGEGGTLIGATLFYTDFHFLQ
jgi:hypothetical protein